MKLPKQTPAIERKINMKGSIRSKGSIRHGGKIAMQGIACDILCGGLPEPARSLCKAAC